MGGHGGAGVGLVILGHDLQAVAAGLQMHAAGNQVILEVGHIGGVGHGVKGRHIGDGNRLVAQLLIVEVDAKIGRIQVQVFHFCGQAQINHGIIGIHIGDNPEFQAVAEGIQVAHAAVAGAVAVLVEHNHAHLVGGAGNGGAGLTGEVGVLRLEHPGLGAGQGFVPGGSDGGVAGHGSGEVVGAAVGIHPTGKLIAGALGVNGRSGNGGAHFHGVGVGGQCLAIVAIVKGHVGILCVVLRPQAEQLNTLGNFGLEVKQVGEVGIGIPAHKGIALAGGHGVLSLLTLDGFNHFRGGSALIVLVVGHGEAVVCHIHGEAGGLLTRLDGNGLGAGGLGGRSLDLQAGGGHGNFIGGSVVVGNNHGAAFQGELVTNDIGSLDGQAANLDGFDRLGGIQVGSGESHRAKAHQAQDAQNQCNQFFHSYFSYWYYFITGLLSAFNANP